MIISQAFFGHCPVLFAKTAVQCGKRETIGRQRDADAGTKSHESDMKVSEYRLVSTEKRAAAGKRVKIHPKTWKIVLERAEHECEWRDGSEVCGLKEGATDPVGGGTVRLTPDHKSPHSINPRTDPNDPNAWQALCGRHQVVKKNFWDHTTGKLNAYAIIQAAPERVKREIYDFLRAYFGE